ncbi:MAG TPA: cobalamin ABC transporter ATP-binding protein [Sphingobium sp.]|uniref:esterase-like activity of phytase family protein n=1 Tax=unclassified Sphingobium TaxID=2611147 RepID=UPI000EBB5C02|nr:MULTISPECIES: esterase-like activity of phytase family protein [unclassified Sphingobium]WIW88649.1 esterase-like activity of phytase family protein [Sphingobium sp. V4]HAF43142.1 cobalamin ABC transporter ATP-binding protein [Sphingobium sp.]
MTRILIVLALAILLLPAPPPGKPEGVHPGALLVTARPLALNAGDPAARRAGDLRYLGGWELRSANPGFGGISALLASPTGDLLGLSDSGVLMGFHVGAGPPRRRPFIAPLPVRAQDRHRPWWAWDAESITHDPASDRYWVGFELEQAICRYSPGFARVEGCRTWPELVAWPKTGSIESLSRLPDGRFLAIGEMGMTPDGRHEVLLFPGDPADHGTADPIHLRYAPPQGYRPTDVVALDARHLLVLNRRLTLQELFTATIAIVDLPERMEPGALLKARTLARLAPPLLADNFEGMALTREAGRPVLWVISDDNHEFFQRTLLLKFGLD